MRVSEPFRLCPGLLLLLVVGACSHSSAPVSVAPPGPQIVTVELEGTIFTALADGDGIEGKGDFEIRVETPYGSRNGYVTLGTGEFTNLRWVFTGSHDYHGEPVPSSIRLICTEWDSDIFGNNFPDSDMDHRSGTGRFTAPGVGQGSITIGNDNCRVRLDYDYRAFVSDAAPGRPR